VVQTFRGAAYQFSLSPVILANLKRLAQQANATLFMVLLAAFQVLLYRYTGQTDIPVGTRIAGRTQAELEGLVGYFVNALVLRTDLSGRPTFRELLQRVRDVALGAYAHQELPFEKLVEELHSQRDLSRQPLFQVMCVVQNTPVAELELPGLKVSPLRVESRTAKLDLDLTLEETSEDLTGLLEYNTDLFEAETIIRLLEHYRVLLEGIVADPDQPITILPLMTASERQRLLVDWNQQALSVSLPEQSLVELFDAQAQSTPDRVAVLGGGEYLTYELIAQRADQLAHHLCGLGIGPEVPVGVCLDRSPQTLVLLLGILKAGGVYVPLDPSYPSAHLAFILNDTQMPLLLTQSHVLERLLGAKDWGRGASGKPMTICLDTDWDKIVADSPLPVSNLQPLALDALVCIVYTSGSTGQPKGVAVPQRQLLNRFDWMWQAFPFEQEEVMGQRTTVNFSVSLWELLGGVLQGVPTLIVPDEIGRDISALVETLAANHVTRLVVVPSLLRSLLIEMGQPPARPRPKLKLWSVCGEALAPELVERFRATFPEATLLNQYGASEVNDITYYDTRAWTPSAARSVPIGRPIRHMEFYLLDEQLEPVPVGVAGQVYVGNLGLARGYLNHPDWTAERFVPNPFIELHMKGQESLSLGLEPCPLRLYNMGDWARYRADGTLEYLGRRDQQIKVHGVRVELGGVERVLRQHPKVAQAVVVARNDSPGDSFQLARGSGKRILAYVVPRAEEPSPADDELQGYLRRQLPSPMLPTAFVFLEQLPLTPNGKVDRRALPPPDSLPARAALVQADPENEMERTIAAVFQDVLGLHRVKVHQNFFDLGGNSIQVVQVHRQLCQVLSREISIVEIFTYPSVRLLAQRLSQAPTPSSVAFQDVRERARKQRATWLNQG